jgi:hypothetical membrane protein
MVRGALRAGADRWALAAIAGVGLYVAIDVALVFLRPRFSVLHNAESDYGSKGRFAWVMDLNFLLRCALSLAVVMALSQLPRGGGRSRAGLVAISIWALASGLLAFFPDDPVGTRAHGLAKVHLALAAVAFIAVVVGTRLESRALRAEPAWRPVSPALTVLSWGALVPVLLLGKAHFRPHSLGGLYEKLFLAVELAWLLLAATWIALRRVEVTEPGSAGLAGARLS